MLVPLKKKKQNTPFFKKALCERCQTHQKRKQASQTLIFATVKGVLVQEMKKTT